MAFTQSTLAGTYRGVTEKGCVVWRGIRYAHTTRFGLPEPVAAPSQEVLCNAFGAKPAQPGIPAKNTSLEDNPLFLNVYSPAADDARRPVMVWFYGGAFATGSADDYDGSWFAAQGDTVVVTFNYRVGMLGFADLTALGIPNNRGIHDQVAALGWVRENIAAFGGDPERVTIAGQSAGSASVSLMMTIPASQGLFHGAILQSGTYSLIHTKTFAEELGARYRQLLGQDARDVAALRNVGVQRLLDVQQQIGRERPGILAAAPVFDGGLLPVSMQEAQKMPVAAVPLLAGSNRDESRLFELPPLRQHLLRDREKLLSLVRQWLGETAAQHIASAYPDTKAGNRDLATDANFAEPTRHFAERHAQAGYPTWMYEFDKRGLLLGAPHCVELTYLWPIKGVLVSAFRGGPLRGRRGLLAVRMREAWVRFIHHGNPGATWPRYEVKERSVLSFNTPDVVLTSPHAQRRRAWAAQDLMTMPPSTRQL